MVKWKKEIWWEGGLIILFGTRARGDFKRTSDIDLAVSGGDFCRFALDVDEET